MSFDLEWTKGLFERFGIKTVLDLGACHGDSIAAWLGAGAELVHACEPVAPLYDKLVKRFEGEPRVHLHHVALSDTSRTESGLALYNCWSLLPDGDTRADRSIEFWGETFTVKFLTLDTMLEDLASSPADPTADHGLIFTPDLVKIDVEGMEPKVLRGGRRYFTEGRPVVIFEVSYLPRLYGESCEEMIDDIFELGYTIEMFHTPEVAGVTYHDTAAFMEVFPWHTSFDVLLVPRDRR